MAENIEVQKSLIDQITEEMFVRLGGNEAFDAETLQVLKELAERGDLSKAVQVAKIIKAQTGGQP